MDEPERAGWKRVRKGATAWRTRARPGRCDEDLVLASLPRARAAPSARYSLDDFNGLPILLDHVAEVDDALVAGEAAVLVSVWVRLIRLR